MKIGIRGWLLVFVIWMYCNALVYFLASFDSSDPWLGNGGIKNFHSFIPIFLTLLASASAILLTKKRVEGILLAVGFLVLSVVVTTVLVFWSISAKSLFVPLYFLSLVRTSIAACIWIPYLNYSQRVRNTFGTNL